MRDRRIVIGIVSIMLLAGSLAACGSDEESASTESTTPISGAKSSAKEGQDSQKAEASKSSSREDPNEVRRGEEREASKFVPKQHNDSGGGSEQYRAPKGGDNSVQEFGGESDESELDEAAVALHGYFDGRAAGNWAAACEYLGKTAVDQLEKLAEFNGQKAANQGCAAYMKAVWTRAVDSRLKAEAKEADVGSLRVEDDRAFLIYHGFEGKVELLNMEKENGRWKVANLEGFAFM